MTAKPFNANLVTIERKRFSVTQGEVLISYGGVRIEQYGDEIRLIGTEYHGQDDAFWLAVAKREAIARGLAVEPPPSGPAFEFDPAFKPCRDNLAPAMAAMMDRAFYSRRTAGLNVQFIRETDGLRDEFSLADAGRRDAFTASLARKGVPFAVSQ